MTFPVHMGFIYEGDIYLEIWNIIMLDVFLGAKSPLEIAMEIN